MTHFRFAWHPNVEAMPNGPGRLVLVLGDEPDKDDPMVAGFSAVDAGLMRKLIEQANHIDEPHVCPPGLTTWKRNQEMAALQAVRTAAEAVEHVYMDTTLDADEFTQALRPPMAKLSIALRPFREDG
jgi:hypothetical protein